MKMGMVCAIPQEVCIGCCIYENSTCRTPVASYGYKQFGFLIKIKAYLMDF